MKLRSSRLAGLAQPGERWRELVAAIGRRETAVARPTPISAGRHGRQINEV
ncbi:hypothetical protein K1W69_07215 [Hoeflea sp. WL0058]|uniref:Uncharacterized protein n=1 Tax=Flavimaribacter sediminis TaxID=2865987 RepID=A0AAE2ZMC8_9HYPH|nr:hypothetical protein [Flavimaribacter sediminis]MBW8636973.1 hypothetical protein [Flavimaribacter sediminis]